jgi:hypothetical protein
MTNNSALISRNFSIIGTTLQEKEPQCEEQSVSSLVPMRLTINVLNDRHNRQKSNPYQIFVQCNISPGLIGSSCIGIDN